MRGLWVEDVAAFPILDLSLSKVSRLDGHPFPSYFEIIMSIIFIMGVSGSGKTTIGRLLAEKLNLPFYDSDDYHPTENVAKMQSGIPLTDEDRMPWLHRIHELAKELLAKEGGVIACSALKESYRAILHKGIFPQVRWIHLDGEKELIAARMTSRKGHYMPVDLLTSQFDILEKPDYALRIHVDRKPEEIVKQIADTLNQTSLGIIGLGVMGRSLTLNFAEKGFTLSLFNRHVEGKEEYVARNLVEQQPLLHSAKAFDHLVPFVESLEVPRRIILMIEAGSAVDAVLEQIVPLLSSGDVVADCGNSHFSDTQRRAELLNHQGVYFLGVGISGGEKGARHGPSVMPGGSKEGYVMLRDAFSSIAARDNDGKPCCSFIGPDGAGHFIKMVHNGIEYAEMQLIAEVYSFMRHGLGYPVNRIVDLFERWQAELHRSYLLEITIHILRKREGEQLLLDLISDAAKSKGTGSWVLQAAAELGIPSPLISAALHARLLSGLTEERTHAMQAYDHGDIPVNQTSEVNPDQEAEFADAFYLARIINHHLGFSLMHDASLAYHWDLDLREISRVWTNGCIIRSAFMERLSEDLKPGIPLLLQEMIIAGTERRRSSLSNFLTKGIGLGIALPCHSAAFNFLQAYTQSQPTGNLIQAQRDYFGAHGFQRVDDLTGRMYHGGW